MCILGSIATVPGMHQSMYAAVDTISMQLRKRSKDTDGLQADKVKALQDTASDHELDASNPKICQNVGNRCVLSAVVW